ncbi:MAG: hypothetical protein ACRCVJ_05465 [Clostridium sp.]|uniref:hypothetical protein n=1 Tax=Clostridium sp. TaxID=1506 RepID=UPI003F2C7257
MRKINKRLIQTLVIAAVLSVNTVSTFADSSASVSITPGLNESVNLYPGKSEDISLYIENNDENVVKVETIYMELKSCKDLETNEMLSVSSKQVAEVLENSTAKLIYEEKVLFEDKLKKLANEKKIVLPNKIDIKPKEKEILSLVISSNEEMGNDAKSLEVIFSMGTKYKMDTDIIDPSGKDDETTGKDDNSSIDSLPKTGIEFNKFILLGLGAIGVGINLMRSKK